MDQALPLELEREQQSTPYLQLWQCPCSKKKLTKPSPLAGTLLQDLVCDTNYMAMEILTVSSKSLSQPLRQLSL
jgi:hypothetical protein